MFGQLKICQIYSNILLSFSRSVVPDSLRPHGLQHIRPPCPLPTPGVYSNSCPLSPDAIQPPHPLSSPSPPAFNLSQNQGLFQWVGSSSDRQNIGASASVSALPLNIQDWFILRLTGLVLQSKGLSRVFSNTTIQKYQFFGTQPSLWSNSHIHTWLLGKP